MKARPRSASPTSGDGIPCRCEPRTSTAASSSRAATAPTASRPRSSSSRVALGPERLRRLGGRWPWRRARARGRRRPAWPRAASIASTTDRPPGRRGSSPPVRRAMRARTARPSTVWSSIRLATRSSPRCSSAGATPAPARRSTAPSTPLNGYLSRGRGPASVGAPARRRRARAAGRARRRRTAARAAAPTPATSEARPLTAPTRSPRGPAISSASSTTPVSSSGRPLEQRGARSACCARSPRSCRS